MIAQQEYGCHEKDVESMGTKEKYVEGQTRNMDLRKIWERLIHLRILQPPPPDPRSTPAKEGNDHPTFSKHMMKVLQTSHFKKVYSLLQHSVELCP